MADWAAFAAFATVVLCALLLLARASQTGLSASTGDPDAHGPPAASGPGNTDGFVYPLADQQGAEQTTVQDPKATRQLRDLSPASLLLNVALSQGLFASLLLFGLWYTGVPLQAIGLSPTAVALGDVALGVAFGVGLYLLNEGGARVGRRMGLGGSEALREALAPETPGGWLLLLGGVLPVIAGFEELLFRGVLVGAFAVGFGVSPWLLAGLSSVAFALGHGAQGAAGVVVTGVLGFVLAAGYILSGSLVAVIVAHYLINALELVVHELVGVGSRAASHDG